MCPEKSKNGTVEQRWIESNWIRNNLYRGFAVASCHAHLSTHHRLWRYRKLLQQSDTPLYSKEIKTIFRKDSQPGGFRFLWKDHTFKMEVHFHPSLCCFITSPECECNHSHKGTRFCLPSIWCFINANGLDLYMSKHLDFGTSGACEACRSPPQCLYFCCTIFPGLLYCIYIAKYTAYLQSSTSWSIAFSKRTSPVSYSHNPARLEWPFVTVCEASMGSTWAPQRQGFCNMYDGGDISLLSGDSWMYQCMGNLYISPI